jgi:hypothetical protein
MSDDEYYSENNSESEESDNEVINTKTPIKFRPTIVAGIQVDDVGNDSDIESLDSHDGIISGIPVYNNDDTIIGLVYTIISNKIIIIPLITIHNYIQYNDLKNIFSKIKHNIIRKKSNKINKIVTISDEKK